MNIRPEVERFAELMEWKLRANDHKPGFQLMSLQGLIERMREEALGFLNECEGHCGL